MADFAFPIGYTEPCPNKVVDLNSWLLYLIYYSFKNSRGDVIFKTTYVHAYIYTQNKVIFFLNKWHIKKVFSSALNVADEFMRI